MSEIYLKAVPDAVRSWCKRNAYLTIEAIEDGVNVNIYRDITAESSGKFEIQLNDGVWTSVSWSSDVGKGKFFNVISKASGNSKSSMSTGDKLRFRNIDKWNNTSLGYNNAYLRVTDAKAEIYGKLAKSLTSKCAASTQAYKFQSMFNGSKSLVDASDLSLDDIALGNSCYSYMFYNCPALVNAPALPATALTDGCYVQMFAGCESLSGRIDLPATALANNCYANMFNNCGTAIIKEVHMPVSLSGHFDASTFGPNDGCRVVYDL